MLKLKGKHIYLRALEPSDLEFLYQLENNPEVWEISGTTTPYSRHTLQNYLDNAHRDIYEVKQLRLTISAISSKTLGFIDLFDFDPRHRRAGLGIVVLEEKNRNKGIGTEAISLMCDYAFTILDMHQIYAHVLEDNAASIRMFQKLGFEYTGARKDWVLSEGVFKNELLFQKIKN
jgi:diamine N-acetyltransferase